jgi:transcriptional regulator with XRE-family HTH domain
MSSEKTLEPEPAPNRLAAQVITDARQRVGISQRELARRSGVPGPVVNAIERSRRQPTVPTLAKLLRGMGLELRLSAVLGEIPGQRPSDDSISFSAPITTSRRLVSSTEKARAREIHNALDLANRIQRAKRMERARKSLIE